MTDKKKAAATTATTIKPSDNQDNQTTPELSSRKNERINIYRAGVPPKYRKMYDRVISGKGTPRQAIRLQCLACWGWSRADAADCGGYDCTLFPYNPFYKPVKSPTERLQQSGNDEQGDDI